MALYIEAIAAVVFTLGVPEVVKAGTKQTGQGRKRADMATQVTAIHRMMAVGLDHHGHSVPAHVSTQTLFNLQVARRMLLLLGLDGVDIARGGRKRHVNALLAGMLQELFEQEVRAFRALGLDHGGQGVHPLAGLKGVDVAADLKRRRRAGGGCRVRHV